MNHPAFSSLKLANAQLKNLENLGYQHMTPIQAQSLPWILQGRDVIAQAKTGSGKTAAFGIGLLERIHAKYFGCQALILCPTRELAAQVANEIRKLARYQHNIKVLTLCGGMPIGPQIGSLAHGAHIIVGTPGRIQDHLRKATLDISQVKTLVLDEADRMLDMGFAEAIADIVQYTPVQRQTLLFSATYPQGIQAISAGYQQDPVTIKVEEQVSSLNLQQKFFAVKQTAEKPQALAMILNQYQAEHAVIFCNTKQDVSELTDFLENQGYYAQALHGDLQQNERDQVLIKFANLSTHLLIATDVAARGLDISDLPLVINYDLARDPEVHVHRIGRTGRAGKAGLAISLCTEKEYPQLMRIEQQMHISIQTTAIRPTDAPHQHNKQTPPKMQTLMIDGGKKNKVRAGDLLGALTNEGGIQGQQVGKINILDYVAYVAVATPVAQEALQHLLHSRIKGRKFKVRRV
ncbi:ATP-independent RNA helicase DbpA [Allopseudospirillum japonicum]|uniref:ATP-independent RNA helicase DbpA n=1 Tax=Allopseudospirillum japonicum TaxID=64971 RepID=A0A1H6T1Q0_9GAMM|nr:ATP-dependent RNA helicase DbpA [Allopseudospirillum japonicum]SEI74049.1 ATP-independent RNA helicase DbpA [Allopseudospirillum japonicum]